ncbi:hypothetical protein C8_10 [Cannes 8 virus]|uniref:Uncharacterized protein n=1 Tax=Marseillevirus marseillevirus TaxID=694581 RepID=D2XA26_GBMV|nr:hypothetical protein MAR_ORF010 [Marseillevirus marseillevirus]YP_009094511.1 hypothetical protein MEL_010 [Melbournevirus]AGV01359.1 hypothetical protein C8_10 [Cannes 8 virus]AVR52715.1 hypothetical protein MarSH_010 [Marseillevirus Shanghai 1]ADB03803.1 hypothetical protein MAR_ORF010 [Marseillevirus marseillevirus]AIT54623.1 hypothetical protein MEL_010 [Melbournevirus]
MTSPEDTHREFAMFLWIEEREKSSRLREYMRIFLSKQPPLSGREEETLRETAQRMSFEQKRKEKFLREQRKRR